MASPISATIPLKRCWTTERVMGSTDTGICSTRSHGTNDASQFHVSLFSCWQTLLPVFLWQVLLQAILPLS